MRAERRVTPAAAGLVLAAMLVVGTVGAAPERRTENLLMIQGEGETADFRLSDPLGRVAVIAVDSAMSAIPGCDVEKKSDFPDHDDSDFDPDSLDLRAYGGGVFTLEDAVAGEWHVDALAASGCEDSCGVRVGIWSMRHVNGDGRVCWLRPGEGARWRVTLAPLDQREGRVWARIEFERRTTIAKLRPRTP